MSGAVVVSGLLQGTLGLLGVPGHLFPHCGPLVLAPSLIVAGLSAHREVALFCSAHWGLASLYVSFEKYRVVTRCRVCAAVGGWSCWPGQNEQLSGRDNAMWIWNQGLWLALSGLPDFHTISR